ncbi:hypothetical protein [Bullifex sp.]|uniref:hypothetical protein n=1 Tax=Bullifex sp. TaxID=2815808 RepID=UPI002A7FB8D5|nr:hypothetical protein [Bullifex sp.]MDY4066455.1 hypothetical protein [Bullifex sp.]
MLHKSISQINTNCDLVKERLNHYILSASGLRAVFASSGNEEDPVRTICDEDKVIVVTIARAFDEFIKAKGKSVIVGQDARPTGYALSLLTIKALISLGQDVKYLYISAAPEIMAQSHNYDYFYYISASHNPIGHNGFKFGYKGGVFSKPEAEEIISILRRMISSPDVVEKAKELISSCPQEKRNECLVNLEKEKYSALEFYRSFVLKTADLPSDFKTDVGIVADFNGSARAASIDRTLFKEMGIKFSAINDVVGDVKHAIVPEGENLIPVMQYLEKMHSEDPSYTLGYTPDNDGDRGNFVYITREGKGRILEAQEVFALVVTIEVASLAKKGITNIAVAVNGPTSERIDKIASTFGAKVFRAEVGEANVVNLGQELVDKGYTVKVLGEGSNGGNITKPASVRDPLNTAFTFLKLLSDKSLFDYILEKLGKSSEEISLDALLDALPQYTTTGAFSTLAKMQVKSKDWAQIKLNYEKLLQDTFDKEMKGKIPACSFYRVLQTEGTVEREGIGPDYRSPLAKGGLKVQFVDFNGQSIGYMWMRPSGTEPVLRVLVDIKGKNEVLHDEILKYQRSLIERC